MRALGSGPARFSPQPKPGLCSIMQQSRGSKSSYPLSLLKASGTNRSGSIGPPSAVRHILNDLDDLIGDRLNDLDDLIGDRVVEHVACSRNQPEVTPGDLLLEPLG